MAFMPNIIFNAAMAGDTSVLENASVAEHSEGSFVLRTPDLGNNIVHIAARHGQLEFINATMRRFPDLLRQRNNIGNTPLHEASDLGTKETVKLLITHLRSSRSSSSNASYHNISNATAVAVPYLLEQNNEGDTPIHVALRSRNLAAAEGLCEEDVFTAHREIFVIQNKIGETPLHLYVRYCAGGTFPRNLKHNDNHNIVDKPKLIYQLIEANTWALLTNDLDGFNPLMRASQYGRVLLVLCMLSYKLSMECRDKNGRSFLHHLRLRLVDLNARDKDYTLWICKKILAEHGVDTLIFSRDNDGNTPLHLAITDKDFDIAELILQRYVEAHLSARKELIMNIKNKDGKTVFDLVTTEPGIWPPKLKKLMEQASMGSIMDTNLYKAAKTGNVNVFRQYTESTPKGAPDDDYFLAQAIDGRNILHISLQQEHIPFLEKALDNFPNLIYQKDSNGDTPLHIAARLHSDAAYTLLMKSFHYWYDNNRDNYLVSLRVPPWKVKNSRNHTPLQEAARNSNYRSLISMSVNCITPEIESEAMSDVNEVGETVLHLIARYGQKQDAVVDPDGDGRSGMVQFVQRSKNSLYMRDIDGLTPILRAANCGQIWLVILIGKWYPKSLYLSDYRGRTVLHHLCTCVINVINELEGVLQLWEPNSESFLQWEQNSKTYLKGDDLIFSRDHDGNTPLHLAIMSRNFEVAHYFIRHYIKVKSSLRDELSGIKNNEGKSIMNLITCVSDISPNLKKLIEQASRATIMDDMIYKATTEGDTNVFSSEPYDPRMFCQAHDGSNIMHIALRHNHISFLNKAFTKAYLNKLIYWKDAKGDTPLHVAVGLQTPEALEFFKLCVTSHQPYNEPRAWTVRNSKGNTVLHEAARLCNYKVIEILLSSDYNTDINDVNDDGENVLHLIARYATYEAKDFLEKVAKQMKSLVYMRDFEGFTPVLRAVQCGRLGVARFLIQQYPQSIAIADNKGRTVLHHMRSLVVDLADDLKDIVPIWTEIFKQHGVGDLRFAQDEDGNTPMHLAIIGADSSKSKFLMEMCLKSKNKRELDTINNDAQSVYDLLSSQANIPAMKELQQLVSRSYVKEREYIDYLMDDQLYQAAVKGIVNIFEKDVPKGRMEIDVECGKPKLDEAYFCRQTPGGSNIIHIALRHGNFNALEFVKIALDHFPKLCLRPDSNGDTPLHLAAKWKSGVPVDLLISAAKKFLNELNAEDKAFTVPPWKVKNYKGSFPIHEALQADNLVAAYALLNCDDEASSCVNDLGETPLHAFAKYGFSFDNDEAAVDKFVKTLILSESRSDVACPSGRFPQKEKESHAAYKRDGEGLTPLLSAAKSGRFRVVRAILKYCPQSAYLRNPSGSTFLHLLRFTGEDVDDSLSGNFKNIGKQLFAIPEADAQRLVQDYEGNTPLHHAIISENSIAAIVLTERCLEDKKRRELGLVNKKGQTIPDLLASNEVPNEIIESIRKKVPEAVYLARSSYGIHKKDMKASANSLSVVAALLATITFAAGLQVPGGFDSDSGSPVLLANAAFAAFLVSNTIAMCCSMLCLFLLLWVMGIGKIHGSLMVLDISIILLEFSFYLTLLAFTLGVFVVTVKKSFWLAILVCGLSFLTFLLTRKVSIQLLAKYGGRAAKAINKFKMLVKSSMGYCGIRSAEHQDESPSPGNTEEVGVANN